MSEHNEFVPGEWVCDACGFVLTKNVLNVQAGNISSDTDPTVEACPNDGTAMRQVRWDEALHEARKLCSNSMIRSQRLSNAIFIHRAQKADDRCIEDDDALYAVLGDGIKCDRRVGDKAEMLKNCQRFIENRCEGGGWKTYKQLENKIAVLRMMLWKAEPHLENGANAHPTDRYNARLLLKEIRDEAKSIEKQRIVSSVQNASENLKGD